MEKEDFVFGKRAVMEAISTGRPIDKILFRKGAGNELFRELYEQVKTGKIPFQFVPAEKLNRITRKNHQGVIALLSPIDFYKPEEILPAVFEKGRDPLLLILDQVSDVRNFGAIVRSAECAGVDAVIVPEKGSARINADAVKTSAGALFNVPVCRTPDLLSTIGYLKDSGITLIAATEKADKLYTSVKMNTPVAIVAGSEEKGISKELLASCDELVKIPMFGKIGSLNVSAACTVLIYEAVRQRGTGQ